MKKRAIYPGSFDPVTYGHIDVIKRASQIFKEVIVAVAANTQKNPLFSARERVAMLKEATKDIEGISVDSFDGLAVEYVKAKQAKVMIRGLRMISDFEYEFQMALTNRKLDDSIETIFMMPSPEYSFISSKLIKEAASLGADTSGFVPKFVEKALHSRLKDK